MAAPASSRVLLRSGIGMAGAGVVGLLVVASTDLGKADQLASVVGVVLAAAGLGISLWGQFGRAGTVTPSGAPGVTASGAGAVAAGGSIGSVATGNGTSPAPTTAPAPQPPATPGSAPGSVPGPITASGDRSVAAGGDIGSVSTGDA
ncbi:hypothetical protein ACPB9E_06315 [Streptomyces exfoliatus]|uniref:hypothetical protein n=1 Tax=Streptomyces exfoliatus TaxID=1905 RepID=UPI003C2EB567